MPKKNISVYENDNLTYPQFKDYKLVIKDHPNDDISSVHDLVFERGYWDYQSIYEFSQGILDEFKRENPNMVSTISTEWDHIMKDAHMIVHEEYQDLLGNWDDSAYPCRNNGYEMALVNLENQAAFNCGGPEKFSCKGIPKIVETAIDALLYGEYADYYNLTK